MILLTRSSTARDVWLPRAQACLLALLLASVASARAAEVPLGMPLSQAFMLALQSHPSIAARVGDKDAAGHRLDAAEWLRYPTLSAQRSEDREGRGSVTTRIELPLWTGGQISGQIDGARASLDAAGWAVIQAQQEILIKVATGYSELGRVAARQAVARANVAEHDRLVALIERRVASQINAPSDAIQARARLAQARAELVQLDAQHARARAALAQAVGIPVLEVQAVATPALRAADLSSLTHAALGFAPQLARLRSEEEGAEAEISVRRGAALPRVLARYDQTHGHAEVRGRRFYVGVEFQSGAGLGALASTREAQSRLDSIRHTREAARRELIEAVAADWGDLQALEAQIGGMREQVESSTSVYESYVRQHAVGRKSWLDVLNAQREAVNARIEAGASTTT